MGHQMLSWYPWVPIGGLMGINCAILTYNGTAFFGFTGDVHAAPDLERLEKFVDESFAELQAGAASAVAIEPTVEPPVRKRPRPNAKIPVAAKTPVAKNGHAKKKTVRRKSSKVAVAPVEAPDFSPAKEVRRRSWGFSPGDIRIKPGNKKIPVVWGGSAGLQPGETACRRSWALAPVTSGNAPSTARNSDLLRDGSDVGKAADISRRANGAPLPGHLKQYRNQGRFLLHEFVLMPDHLHLLLTPARDISLEKALQFVKGGFPFRVKRELGSNVGSLAAWICGTSNTRLG